MKIINLQIEPQKAVVWDSFTLPHDSQLITWHEDRSYHGPRMLLTGGVYDLLEVISGVNHEEHLDYNQSVWMLARRDTGVNENRETKEGFLYMSQTHVPVKRIRITPYSCYDICFYFIWDEKNDFRPALENTIKAIKAAEEKRFRR